jgi:hypothetical protein
VCVCSERALLSGTIISGLVMSSTLNVTGSKLGGSDVSLSMKEVSGPCINVLTKLVTIVGIVNVAHANWVSCDLRIGCVRVSLLMCVCVCVCVCVCHRCSSLSCASLCF